MKFVDFLNESYYHEEIKTYFEKLFKVTMVSESNRTEYDEYVFKSEESFEKLKVRLKNKIDKTHDYLNRQKNPGYNLILERDGDFYKLSIYYMVDLFRKKKIYHGTSSHLVKDIMEKGILPYSALKSDIKKDADTSDTLIYRLYNGSFFFGAKSLAMKYAKAKYGADAYALEIDNSDGKYNKHSYYEPNSKEKFGYSHSFFITVKIDPADISL